MLRVIALLSCAVFLGGAPTLAQSRPVFKQPFLCAQSWDASTYQGHGPDEDSLDFGYWRDRSTKAVNETENLSHGQYILASAAGTVERDDIVPDDDNGQVRRIKIVHANGWATNYLHAIIEPPFLNPGRKVAMGEVIARTGCSGTGFSNDHIHYTQRDPSNEGVRVQFDRVNVETHEGDPSTWGLWLSDQAERIRSANCTAASFIRWREGGDNYIFRYRPSQRQARITRMNADGRGGTHTWTGQNWGRSWTHYAQWKGSDGGNYLIQYSAPRGRAQFFRIERDGVGLTLLQDTDTWDQHWTILKRAAHNGHVYLVAYDSLTGYQQILKVDDDNRSAAATHVIDDIEGWTHILPFDNLGAQFFVYYKAATGRISIRHLIDDSRPNENGTRLRLETVYDGHRRAGWTHMTLARDRGNLYLLGFRATSGEARMWRIGAPANGPEAVSHFNLNRKWDIITSLKSGDQARIFLYGTNAGDSAIMDVNDDGSGLTRVTTFDWQGGWR